MYNQTAKVFAFIARDLRFSPMLYLLYMIMEEFIDKTIISYSVCSY